MIPVFTGEARAFWRERWTGKSLMAIGMKDPVLGPPVMRALHAEIRNCPPPMEIAEGGHFLQEWGKEVAEAATRAL
jgi:haloalkane dehalogenase